MQTSGTGPGGEAATPSLQALVAAPLRRPPPAPVRVLAEALAARFGESLVAVLAYGSCLRDVAPQEGLIDLYAVVSDYRSALSGRWRPWTSALLPPGVFYLEMTHGGQRLRAKYAVISRADLAAGIGRWFHPYLWGRFAQPALLAWGRDDDTAEAMAALLAPAVPRLLAEAAPMLAGGFDADTLWCRGLVLSYGSELRPEAPERVRTLVAHDRGHYRALTRAALPWLSGRLALAPGGTAYICPANRWQRAGARLRWRARRIQGVVLSVLRFVKAGATFDGGVDYAAWKLERHTGQPVHIDERVRRHPLIFGWGLFGRLLRRGMLR